MSTEGYSLQPSTDSPASVDLTRPSSTANWLGLRQGGAIENVTLFGGTVLAGHTGGPHGPSGIEANFVGWNLFHSVDDGATGPTGGGVS